MSRMTDEHLREDPRALYYDLYETYHQQMLRLARHYLSNNPNCLLADDVVSEVFAKLWEIRSSLHEIKEARKFLFVMVKRRCLDELAKHTNKKRQTLENAAPRFLVNFKNPETAYLNRELGEQIRVSLEKLPHKCRTAFLLVKEDRLRYREVAQLLDISEKTVEMHVSNALRALRKDLQAYVNPLKKS